jgi:hypothetical protein
VDGIAVTQKRAPSATDGVQSVDEVGLGRGNRGRFPPELRGRHGRGRTGTEVAHQSVVRRLTGMERLVRHGRLDPVQPAVEEGQNQSTNSFMSKKKKKKKKKKSFRKHPLERKNRS